MAKVLVERPRFGSRLPNGPGKGARKRLGRALATADGPPTRERMTRWSKQLNEHLGPLRRFLQSNAGRPWAIVYAGICEHVRPTSAVQNHILTHLFQFVATAVRLIDGQPCDPATGRPLDAHRWGPIWYVCPRTGLLRAVPHTPRRRWREPCGGDSDRTTRVASVDRTTQVHRIAGQWELVTVAPLPTLLAVRVRDVVWDRNVGVGDESAARRRYGAAVYAVSRRPLSKFELMRYPIPIDLISDRRQPDRVPRR